MRKKTCQIVGFADPADGRVKLKESKKKDKYIDLAIEIKKKQKTIEHEGDCDTNCNCCARNNPQRIGKGTEKLGNKRTSGDHLNNSIIWSAMILRRVLET